MTADYDEVALRKVGERTLTGKIGEPHEIAAVDRDDLAVHIARRLGRTS